MSFTHTIQKNWSQGNSSLSGTKSYESGAEKNISEAIASDASDLLVEWTMDITQLKSLFISADQDLTIEANDNAGTGGIIALKAGDPYEWNTDSPHTLKFSTDVTALYITNDSDPATATTLEIRAVYDPTV